MRAPRAQSSTVSISMQDAAQARSRRINEVLESFSIDECPFFSRTVLTSSPVLLALHLASGDTVPLPHVAVGTSCGSPPSTCLVRRTSATSVAAAMDFCELPEALHQLLRLHKRAAYSLFRRWEDKGMRMVPLDAFASGVHEICGIRLTDDDMLTILQCVEPVRGEDVTLDPHWRSRLLDSHRLWVSFRTAA